MKNEEYLKITNAVYALLDLFPDDDPLRNKAKEKALAVLDDLIAVGFLMGIEKEKTAGQAVNDIESLLSYLNLANLRGFLSKLNLIIVIEQYQKIIQEIKPIADALKQRQAMVVPAGEAALAGTSFLDHARPAAEGGKWNKISELLSVKDVTAKKETLPAKTRPSAGREKNSDRQDKIIKILGEKGKAQVADLKQIMPEVTKRTLRRDLDDLLKRAKVDRVGEWNQTFYQIRTS